MAKHLEGNAINNCVILGTRVSISFAPMGIFLRWIGCQGADPNNF